MGVSTSEGDEKCSEDNVVISEGIYYLKLFIKVLEADMDANVLFLVREIYMLFTGREVRMGKNCARGLEYGPRPTASGRTQDLGHSFFPYGPT